MRIAITGSKGQLGTALQQRLVGEALLPLDLPEWNVADAAQVSSALEAFAPEVVIHTAALTNVDQCEVEPDAAYRVNALGTQNVALACQRLGAAMVYISTDYVFDGTKDAPYLEYDPPSPLSVYARSKVAGEWYTQALLSRFYIVRPAWLYARGGHGFLQTVLRLARERGSLSMVTDEVGSPTYAPDLADAIARLIPSRMYGIYHFTNSGVCSRYEWACAILRLSGLDHIPVTPSQGYVRKARVPRRVELRNFCGATQLGIVLRPWQEALVDCLREPQ